MRWGLLGGSFNPIHHGHLILATRVAEALRLDRIFFIPTAISPLKPTSDLAPAPDRWAMLKLAIAGNSLFAASDLEIRRGGISYTIDTVRQLQKGRETRLFLILGADAARLLSRWKGIHELKRLVTFAFVARPGHRPSLRMPKQYIIEAPLLEISGTDIRERVREGLSIRYLVPEAVDRYIRRKGLYR